MGAFERLEEIFNKNGDISLYDIAVSSEVMTGAWLNRTIRTRCELSYPVGSVFTSLSCESWSDGGEYECQFDGNFEYVFLLRGNIPCHVVDYGLDCEFSHSYYEALGTSPDYSCEREVVVPHGTLFRVMDVDTYVCPDGITRSFVELAAVENKF